MIDFFMSGYGLSSLGLVGIVLLMLYMKMMKWIFEIAILGIALIVAFWYLKPAITG